ncbi:MAG TPA: hypothetical protein QGI71_10835 [Dehalococcoidia bacterium]|nr:hypothetical protein [Dehalococcoidia bacterium]
MRDLLELLCDEQPDAIVIDVTVTELRIEAPAPESEYGIGDSPLHALFDSLTAHAGTQVQTLAEVQVQLGRQDGSITFEDDRTVARVALTTAS